ncbi:carbohydrate ABC transporter permease [Paracoccus aminophilus]|uniref:sn-glycerol-3-phosphate transport system permease protein n=1 Tax=Paracoccus aminophilus JCM 7686 TaxID=1367847 RepID=S5XYR2_PARAH|nr:carbohydrate ABC transporter permease [Paracoccus aminophilus]AGT08565.1 sn-glycerol-3-phosphate transport system permease protein [Paracoccus aminophilus JCM 7686]
MSRFLPHRFALHVVLVILCLVTLFPLLWMVTAAFTPQDQITAKALRFWPEDPTLGNFTEAARRHPIWLWLGNSMLTAGLITLGKLALSLPAGYAFARMEFKGRDTAFWIVVATMSFPSVLAIIPTYIAVVKLGAFDSYGAMIVPMIPYVGFYVFYFRQSFRQLPASMFEAARIDGAGIWKQFVQIGLPNVVGSIAALSVISFLGAWNIYLWGQLVLEDTTRKTLTTGIAMFADLDGAQTPWGALMATSLLSVLPVLAVFLMAQRYIVEALAPGLADK